MANHVGVGARRPQWRAQFASHLVSFTIMVGMLASSPPFGPAQATRTFTTRAPGFGAVPSVFASLLDAQSDGTIGSALPEGPMPSRHVDPQFTPLDADPSHAFVFAGAPADAQQWLTSGAPRSVLNPVALVNSLNSAAAGPRLLMIGPSLLSSELDFARPLVEAQRTIAASAARRRSAGRSREGLATVALQYGDFSGAAFQLEHAIALARKTGDDWSLATLLTGLGDVSRARGTYQRASELYAESEALHRRLGTEPAPTLRHNQAYVALHAGNLRDAHNLFNESLRLYQSYSEQRGMAECLVGLAGVAAATGDRSRAAMLLGAAEAGFDAVRAQISHPIGAISHAYPAS